MVDGLQVAFDNRMNTHEKELLVIMKKEIEKMLEDIQRVIIEYN
jgi:hypothetical protein